MKNISLFPEKENLKFVFQDSIESGDVVTELTDAEKEKLLVEGKQEITPVFENELKAFVESELSEVTIQQIRERVEKEMEDNSREFTFMQIPVQEKLKNPEFQKVFVALQKGGVMVDGEVVYYLTEDKITPEFINTFLLLQQEDITVTGWVIELLTKEKNTPEFINTLIELKKAGAFVDGGAVECLTIEKNNPQFIKTLLFLQQEGIIVDSDIIDYLTKEKNTPEYINMLLKLKNAGIEVDGRIIEHLTIEKNNPEYVNALITLHEAGINIYGWFIKSLTKEKVDSGFINILITLSKSGIKVDNSIVDSLTEEKTHSSYINTLIELQKEGVSVNGWVIKSLTKEKMDPEFIKILITLQQGGFNVGGSTIKYLTKEKATPDLLNALIGISREGVKLNSWETEYIVQIDFAPRLMSSIIDLHKAGITVDLNLMKSLTVEKTAPEFIDVFGVLQREGIVVNSDLIENFTKEKLTVEYINTLIELQKKVGIKVDSYVIKSFTNEQATPTFINTLTVFKDSGMEIDSYVIRHLTQDKLTPEYINTLLIKLPKGGITVNKMVIARLTTEKIVPEFINALITLKRGGIEVDHKVIDFLTVEKTAPEFINSFIALKKAGIEVGPNVIALLTAEKTTPEFINSFITLKNAGLTIDALLIKSFTKEKITPVAMDFFITLQKKGIKVDSWIVNFFTEERLKDSVYTDLFIAKKGDFAMADAGYLQKIFQIDEEEEATINTPEQFYALKFSPEATPVAKQILTRHIKRMLLHSVRRMNDRHEESHERRLEEVKDFSTELLYETIVLGNDEVFTSTFNILFDEALMPKLKNNSELKGNGYNLLQKINREGMRTFLRTCAQYNKLQVFLDTMKGSQQAEILKAFASGLDTADNKLAEAVTLGETLVYILSGQKETLAVLESTIKKEYERLEKSNPDAARLYGLIASTHAKTATTEKAWFQSMQEKYKIPDLGHIEAKELFLENDVNVQQHFFYDDTERGRKPASQWDGHNSFRHFLRVYGGDVSWDKDGTNIEVTGEGREGWVIEDKGSYVSLKKVSKNGKKIEIYANKPDQEDDGPEEIQKSFEARDLKSIVIVHRGHSYHANKTIRRIPDIARIVNMGSCGGFNNMSAVLDKSPNAHVLATKGTGSMLVNDVLFKRINERILTGEDMHWPTFWAEMERDFAADTSEGGKKAYEYFRNYVPPHKNIGTQIIRAYNSSDE